MFAVGLTVVAIFLWLYLEFSPPKTTLKYRAGFETFVLFLEIVGCAVASYYAYSTHSQGSDSLWWRVVAVFYIMILVPSIFILSALSRRLIYRKKISPNQSRNPIGQVCSDTPLTSTARPSRWKTSLLRGIHVVLGLWLIYWAMGAPGGGWLQALILIAQNPLSAGALLALLMLAYPVLFGLGVWRSRVASKAGHVRRAYLWILPAGVVMLPVLLLSLPDAAYMCLEFYGREVSKQGRFIEAIMAQSKPETIESFMRAGANPNQPGKAFSHSMAGTPLEASMLYNRSLPVVKSLLKMGATPKFDKSLYYAVSTTGALADTNTVEFVRLFLAAGASPSRTILHGAMETKQPINVVSLLLEAGADINSRDSFGHTPLTIAARESEGTTILDYLLSKGSQINAVDNNGDSALVWASAREDGLPLVLFLLDHGANVAVTNQKGRTALMTAARRNKNPHIATALVAGGADINAKDSSGMTALIIAYLENTYEVCSEMVNLGANTQVRDSQGKTVIDYARMYRESQGDRYEILFGKGSVLNGTNSFQPQNLHTEATKKTKQSNGER
jgi:ankyrin repeat protein